MKQDPSAGQGQGGSGELEVCKIEQKDLDFMK